VKGTSQRALDPGFLHSAPNRRWKSCFSRTLYKGRNAVERMFCRLEDYRLIATRYDKLANNFLAAIYLAAAVISWLLVCTLI
jgi:transposase